MNEDNDMESEERDLYGDPSPAETGEGDPLSSTAEGANSKSAALEVAGIKNSNGGEVNPVERAEAIKEDLALQESVLTGTATVGKVDVTPPVISSSAPGSGGDGGLTERGEGEVKQEDATDIDKKGASGTAPAEALAAKSAAENSVAKDAPKKEKAAGDESDEESGDSGESGSEDGDEDDDQDDFDVVLNCEDVETAPRPGGPSFGGPIGKVRLPLNKWQRPGYVPQERVIGTAAQTGARTGGVLSMLPTPTMQIGVSQKSVYDLEIGKLTEKPWLERGADLSDYFNYGFNEETWKLYCERQMQMRLEASMLAKIKTVDGNKSTNVGSNRAVPSVTQKIGMPQQNAAQRVPASGAMAVRPGTQIKAPTPPAPPSGAGVLPPAAGMGPLPPGALQGMAGMMKLPNMPNMPNMPKHMLPPNMPPFAFQPGMQNGKGGGFQPPFLPFPPMPGNQRQGDGKNASMFPFPPGMPGVPGMPMPPGVPPGMGRGGNQGRGFPGQMQTPQNLQQKEGGQGRGVKRQSSEMTSRFSSSGQGGPGKPGVHPSRQNLVQGHPQGQHRQGGVQGGQQEDDRRRWNNNRGMGDRRQGYDRSGNDRGVNAGGGDQRGRSGYDDRYGDRGHDRRRSGGWDNRDDGQDRRRGGGGYDNQRYSDPRRDYDRDRDRDREHYRKRGGNGREYNDDDRKRTRR